jgi:hypothetical protein
MSMGIERKFDLLEGGDLLVTDCASTWPTQANRFCHKVQAMVSVSNSLCSCLLSVFDVLSQLSVRDAPMSPHEPRF